MKIFYADDDPEDQELFAEAIEEINPEIELILAADGLKAMRMLEELQDLPHVIFLDINMPAMTGIECLIKLKSMKRFQDVPIFLYSTSSHGADVQRFKEMGAYGFITKANSYLKIRESLREVLNTWNKSA